MRPLSGTTESSSVNGQRDDGGVLVDGLVNGVDNGKDANVAGDDGEEEEEKEITIQPPPLLIATVVAPSADEASNARKAAARLERMGRDFQRAWVREQEDSIVVGADG